MRALTHHVHVNAVCVWPSVLKVILQSLPKRIRYLMKSYELLHLLHLRVIARRAGIESLNYRADIPEYARIHEGCNEVCTEEGPCQHVTCHTRCIFTNVLTWMIYACTAYMYSTYMCRFCGPRETDTRKMLLTKGKPMTIILRMKFVSRNNNRCGKVLWYRKHGEM